MKRNFKHLSHQACAKYYRNKPNQTNEDRFKQAYHENIIDRNYMRREAKATNKEIYVETFEEFHPDSNGLVINTDYYERRKKYRQTHPRVKKTIALKSNHSSRSSSRGRRSFK